MKVSLSLSLLVSHLSPLSLSLSLSLLSLLSPLSLFPLLSFIEHDLHSIAKALEQTII